MDSNSRRLTLILVLSVTFILCKGTDTHASANPEKTCKILNGKKIPAAMIGLPTTGVTLNSAALVRDKEQGEFCKVLGAIHPVDPKAPDIHFQVNLPATWNKKAIQFGGGGLDGVVITGLIPRFPPPNTPTPVKQGYATFGSDSGHSAPPQNPFDATFALNDEAFANYGGDQLKKTRDAAVVVMRLRYGKSPRRVYFQGGSQGGHESLLAMQRWPDSYDGIITVFPIYAVIALQLDTIHIAQTIYNTPGAWTSPTKMDLLYNSVMKACDGLEDGIISNPKSCSKAFDLKTLRCPDGVESGDQCFSDAHIKAIETINSDYPLGVTLQGGINLFPRWPILEGGDVRGISTFGTAPVPSDPPSPVDSMFYVAGDNTVRFMMMRDPSVKSRSFNPQEHQEKILAASKVIDRDLTDIEAFKKRGGKLLLLHGTADMVVTPYSSIMYYNQLVNRFGEKAVHEFMRFYVIPGFGHFSGAFKPGWDSIAVLDAWVEKGRKPEDQVIVDTSNNTSIRTRPLCEYPSWPKYKGSGDPAKVSSLACVTE